MWTLYIIENKYGHLYTGICKDVSKRFAQHQASGNLCAKALRGKGPLNLRYAAQVGDHSTALKAEMWVKKLTRRQKDKLLCGDLTLAFDHALDQTIAE